MEDDGDTKSRLTHMDSGMTWVTLLENLPGRSRILLILWSDADISPHFREGRSCFSAVVDAENRQGLDHA